MNENDQTNVPPPIAPSLAPEPSLLPQPRPLSWWLRKFFACNPFYLVSAALLLYGCYRVSMDAPLLNRESTRLLFSFSAIQAYEILLVLVAIFLARRSLWYDSTLLVGLENLLVFVPFILISQASLTGPEMTFAICAVAVTVAMLRFGALKKYFIELNLPGRLLGAGVVFLAVNVALPLLYRHYINIKLGVDLETGPDYKMNECNWLLVLPAVLALANFLPRTQTKGDLLPQHRRLPAGMFSLWFLATGVHLYSLGYVYGYHLRSDLLAPMAWVLAWTLFLRCPAESARLKYALTVPAVLAPLLAAWSGGPWIFLILAALNVAAYAAVSLLNRNNRLAPHLAYASVLLIFFGLPDTWMQSFPLAITNSQCLAFGIAGYVILWTAWLRNPKLAVVGSAVLAAVVMALFSHRAGVAHWALQGAFVFLLLHSLRWNDLEHNSGAGKARLLAGLAWAVQSFVWMNSESGRFWMPLIPGMAVLGIYCVCLPCRGIWRLFAVPAAAMLVILSGPCSAIVAELRATPAGLMAVFASFLFLGLGTVAALTRHLWHTHEHELTTPSSPRTTVMDR
jgi:hypothetical protein